MVTRTCLCTQISEHGMTHTHLCTQISEYGFWQKSPKILECQNFLKSLIFIYKTLASQFDVIPKPRIITESGVFYSLNNVLFVISMDKNRW